MGITKIQRRKALWIGLLLVALLFTGCAGITPYEPRDHREEGPERGLLSGPDGEFIIYRKVDEPEKGSEERRSPHDPESDGQPEADSDQSGNADEPPGDTP